MEAELLDLMPHTVTIETIGSHDAYGAPIIAGAQVIARALVVPGRKRVVRRDGEEVLARGIAHCAGPLVIPSDAVITVPSSLGFPSRMPILDARSYPDESGAVHNVELAY